jgi:hypothetical protein
MAPQKKWLSEAAKKAAYRDRRKGIILPDDHYNSTRSSVPEHQVTYVIEADTGQLKVGIALHPQQRLKELQTGSPVPLRLLGTIPGGRAVEKLLHDTFKEHRLQGEWYSPEIRDPLTTLLSILGSPTPNEKERDADPAQVPERGGEEEGVPSQEEG